MFISLPSLIFVFHLSKVLMTFLAFEIYQISTTITVYSVTFCKIHLI